MIEIFHVGQEFEQKFVVHESVYDGFLQIFIDRNAFHVDDVIARQYGFREKLMHGNILNGFISYFVGCCLPTDRVIIHSQEIRFSLPIYLRDVLDFHATIASISESVGAIEFKFKFLNEMNRKVASGKLQIGCLFEPELERP